MQNHIACEVMVPSDLSNFRHNSLPISLPNMPPTPTHHAGLLTTRNDESLWNVEGAADLTSVHCARDHAKRRLIVEPSNQGQPNRSTFGLTSFANLLSSVLLVYRKGKILRGYEYNRQGDLFNQTVR